MKQKFVLLSQFTSPHIFNENFFSQNSCAKVVMGHCYDTVVFVDKTRALDTDFKAVINGYCPAQAFFAISTVVRQVYLT